MRSANLQARFFSNNFFLPGGLRHVQRMFSRTEAPEQPRGPTSQTVTGSSATFNYLYCERGLCTSTTGWSNKNRTCL